jgi:hypothetical protein
VEVEASFDEFNLDVRLRYAGATLPIPEIKPTPREIMRAKTENCCLQATFCDEVPIAFRRASAAMPPRYLCITTIKKITSANKTKG